MSKKEKDLQDAIVALAGEDIDLCLSVVTGSFVGLYVEVMRRRGMDTSKQITIEGGSRTITIHAETKAKEKKG